MNLMKNIFGVSNTPEKKALGILSEIYQMKENKEREDLVAALVGVTKREVPFEDVLDKLYAYRSTFKEESMGYGELTNLILKTQDEK